MQYVSHHPLLSDMAEGYVTRVLDEMHSVLAYFDNSECPSFSREENHSVWFDASESTYHTSSGLEVGIPILFALCFIMRAGPVLACLEPSTKCDL